MPNKELRYLIQRIKENKYLTRDETNYIIKALEQEPCEDAISRKAVLQMIEDIQDAGGFIGCSTYFEAFDMVDNMSPVTLTRKTGHWIYIGNSDVNGLKICECDVCDKRTYGSHKFCPNCGSKMEIEE